MRFIAFILSIYILTLNFTPCEDVIVASNDIATEFSEIADTDNHNHNALDLCSPFCQCQCCHVNVTHFSAVDFSIASNNISTKIFSHFDNLGEEFPNTLLQPPRV